MTVERMVLIFAGSFILLSLALSQLHHIYWLGFTAFVGFMMFQSGFTGFCPIAFIFNKIGLSTCKQKAIAEMQTQ